MKEYVVRERALDVPFAKMKANLYDMYATCDGAAIACTDTPCGSKSEAIALAQAYNHCVEKTQFGYSLEWAEAVEITMNDDGEWVDDDIIECPMVVRINGEWKFV